MTHVNEWVKKHVGDVDYHYHDADESDENYKRSPNYAIKVAIELGNFKIVKSLFYYFGCPISDSHVSHNESINIWIKETI